MQLTNARVDSGRVLHGSTSGVGEVGVEGTSFTGSTMLVAGGGLCVGVSRAALRAADAEIGDEVELAIAPAAAT
jgi:hypothetical protein